MINDSQQKIRPWYTNDILPYACRQDGHPTAKRGRFVTSESIVGNSRPKNAELQHWSWNGYPIIPFCSYKRLLGITQNGASPWPSSWPFKITSSTPPPVLTNVGIQRFNSISLENQPQNHTMTTPQLPKHRVSVCVCMANLQKILVQ